MNLMRRFANVFSGDNAVIRDGERLLSTIEDLHDLYGIPAGPTAIRRPCRRRWP